MINIKYLILFTTKNVKKLSLDNYYRYSNVKYYIYYYYCKLLNCSELKKKFQYSATLYIINYFIISYKYNDYYN